MRGAFGCPPTVRAVVRAACLALLLLAATAALSPLRAQDKLRQQREELDRIRQERADLERRMLELRANVHDLAEEVTNLNARRSATERLVEALDRQLQTINGEVDDASRNMARTEAELIDKRSTLKRRLVDIYKRGPLFTAAVLLSAQSFGELVARYKYLHMLALHDRAWWLVSNSCAIRSRATTSDSSGFRKQSSRTGTTSGWRRTTFAIWSASARRSWPTPR